MTRQLIVAGFHRSGTSLFAQLLQRAGLFVGDRLLGARPTNPYGHYEDLDVIRLHEQLLDDNGETWHVTRPFVPMISPRRWRQMDAFVRARNRLHRLWGFKDPRACAFLPAWKYLLPDARVVVIYRHPSEVTWSLERRHAVDLLRQEGPLHLHRRFFEEPDHALRLWIASNRALLAFARGYRNDTIALSFDDLVDGLPIVSIVEERWQLGLEDLPTAAVFDPAVTTTRPGRQPLSDRRLAGEVNSVWQQLEELRDRTVAASAVA